MSSDTATPHPTVRLAPLPRLSPGTVLLLARKEIRDALRNRWFLLYALAFTLLALALSLLATAGTGFEGASGFGRTAASLINLVLLIVPLMALTAGAVSIAGERERGTLAYLLAQPISRLELLLGKFVGLATSLGAAIALGFGVSALVMAMRGESADIGACLRLVGLSTVLGLAMLAVGLVVSTLARRSAAGLGVAVSLWLAFVFAGDLGLMGSAIVFQLRPGELFHLSLLNPLQVFRMSSLESVNATLDLLGPAGVFAMQEYPRALPWLFGSALVAWIAAPLALASVVLARRSTP